MGEKEYKRIPWEMGMGFEGSGLLSRKDVLLYTLTAPIWFPRNWVVGKVRRWRDDLRTPPIIRLLESGEREPALDALRHLIAEGADVNARCKEDQETPLLMAARRGWVEACRVLCAAGLIRILNGTMGGWLSTRLISTDMFHCSLCCSKLGRTRMPWQALGRQRSEMASTNGKRSGPPHI